jgi:hypothetical protein
MKLSHTLGMTACAALLVASGFASAADVAAKNNYRAYGYITSATDVAGGALCASFKQAVGNVVNTTFVYPGVGGTMSLITGGTDVTTAAGKANTNVCIATSPVPATGLNGATLTFTCYTDTLAGPAAGSIANITTTFTAAKTSTPTAGAAVSVSANSTLTVTVIPAPSSCTFTQDATWIAQ